MHDVRRHIASCLKFMALTACFTLSAPAVAQELNAKVTINRSQISNTTDAVFEALQNSLTAFINERQWTGMTYEEEERINCTFSITLKTYSETDNSFTGSIQVQSTRPVYDSNYSTTVFNFQDENFNLLSSNSTNWNSARNKWTTTLRLSLPTMPTSSSAWTWIRWHRSAVPTSCKWPWT